TYGSSLFLTLTLDHHLTHFFLLALLTLKFTLFPYTTLFRSGCSLFQSDELTLPHKFRDQSAYHLSDFHLNGQYTYWEVRRNGIRSEEHTSELQSRFELVCRLLLEKKNHITTHKNNKIGIALE